jgi:hypothetical protein
MIYLLNRELCCAEKKNAIVSSAISFVGLNDLPSLFHPQRLPTHPDRSKQGTERTVLIRAWTLDRNRN